MVRKKVARAKARKPVAKGKVSMVEALRTLKKRVAKLDTQYEELRARMEDEDPDDEEQDDADDEEQDDDADDEEQDDEAEEDDF